MKKYLISIFWSLLIIALGTIISSVLYYFNITSDKVNNVLLYLICFSAIIVGSYKIGKETSKKGMISGLIYASIFIILMMLFSVFIFKNFHAAFLIYYLLIIAFSIIGTVTGKNKQKEKD